MIIYFKNIRSENKNNKSMLRGTAKEMNIAISYISLNFFAEQATRSAFLW